MYHLLILIIIGYICALLLIYFFQRKLIYFPHKETPSKENVFIPDIAEVYIKTKDGLNLLSWLVPPKENKPIIVHFHGNAGIISMSANKMQQLAHRGYGFLFVEYRGYSGNPGKPSEKKIISDGIDAINYLKQNNYNMNQIVIYGESIGSGVAIPVAKATNPKALVLECPFDSILEIAKKTYWYFPVSLMVKDKFLNISAIKDVKSPVFIIHGQKDEIVPIAQSKELFNAANEPKEMKIIADAGHNDLFNFGLIDLVDEWLKNN